MDRNWWGRHGRLAGMDEGTDRILAEQKPYERLEPQEEVNR
jgi:hypothetical protein